MIKDTCLRCVAPELPSLMYIGETDVLYGQSQGDKTESDIILNYTVVMDNSPGPSINETELLLTVKPNPAIIEVLEESRVFHVGSKDTLSIIVRMSYYYKKLNNDIDLVYVVKQTKVYLIHSWWSK